MQRFVLVQNIVRFQRQLATEPNEASRAVLRSLMAAARRDLARLDAVRTGIGGALAPSGDRSASDALRRFRDSFEAAAEPYLLLHPGPGLQIVDINDAYARATMTGRNSVAGQRLFDVFPDNPADPAADGVANIYESLRLAVETGRPHRPGIQRYDIRDPDGRFVERHWRPVNTPILDDTGRILYLLHHAEDVTARICPAATP